MYSLKRHIGDIFSPCSFVAVIALITSIILLTPSLTKPGRLSTTDYTVLVDITVEITGWKEEMEEFYKEEV
jgi:hypothetical protein